MQEDFHQTAEETGFTQEEYSAIYTEFNKEYNEGMMTRYQRLAHA